MKTSKLVPSEMLDKTLLGILKTMKDTNQAEFQPHYNKNSKSGYSYPEVAKSLDIQDGTEVYYLELLAQRDCLIKEFYDKVVSCPFCQNSNLNYREKCPNCNSSNIMKVDMIHHFQCAYVGPEYEFQDGMKYVCPKCKERLHHIGVDYDKPNQDFKCNGCETLFLEPNHSLQCRGCEKEFLIDHALKEIVYQYRIAPLANTVLKEQAFPGTSINHGYINEKNGLSNHDYFRVRLKDELERSKLFNHPISMMTLTVKNHHDIINEKGEEQYEKILSDFVQELREVLSPVDLATRVNENQFACLLIETNKDKMGKAAQEIYNWNEKNNGNSVSLGVSMSTLPDDTLHVSDWKRMLTI